MINYLEKFAKTNDGIVVCNWDRGKGKTKAIIDKIMGERVTEDTDFIIVSPNWQLNRSIMIDRLEKDSIYFPFGFVGSEIGGKHVYYTTIDRNNKVERRVFFTNDLNSPQLRGIKPKYIFMDNISPFKIDIETVSSLNAKSVFIMTTDKNFKYIEDDSEIISNNDWINEEIEKLKLEYSRLSNEAISYNRNNTITRQSILDMIINLKSLKEK